MSASRPGSSTAETDCAISGATFLFSLTYVSKVPVTVRMRASVSGVADVSSAMRSASTRKNSPLST